MVVQFIWYSLLRVFPVGVFRVRSLVYRETLSELRSALSVTAIGLSEIQAHTHCEEVL